MFFLLRVAFWLTLVLVLLPSGGGARSGAQAKIDAGDAMAAAGAAVSDMSGFCDRQPTACVVGAEAAHAIGARAQAGARMVYDFISDRVTKNGGETGSITVRKVAAVPSFPGSQSTLKPSDLEPAWQGPPAQADQIDNVPLPRPRPHRTPPRKA